MKLTDYVPVISQFLPGRGDLCLAGLSAAASAGSFAGLSVSPLGSGHIHDTLLVRLGEEMYVLQRFNDQVFPDVDAVMHNIRLVTEYLRRQIIAQGQDPANRVLQVIPTADGSDYYRDAQNRIWRMYPYIRGGLNLDVPRSAQDCRTAALAFGRFQADLKDFPVDELRETIPGFHNTPARLARLHEAYETDPAGRAAHVKQEADFFFSCSDFCRIFEDAHHTNPDELPLRVTHNDTKLNNCMLDLTTGAPLCILDLDTVMPGYSVNDFGDGVRSSAAVGAEDCPDPSLVHMDPARYEAYLDGFLDGCGASLTDTERKLLSAGALMMTLECGMRFLTDYLQGDVYFKISRPDHNLVRARTQLSLARSMQAQLKL